MLNLQLSATIVAMSLTAATGALAQPAVPISQASTEVGPILVDGAWRLAKPAR